MEEPASPRTRPSTPPGTSGPSRPSAHRRVVQHSSSEIDGAEEEFDVPQLERQKSKLASGGARTVSSMVVWLLGRFGCAPGSGTLIGMAIYAVVLYCFLLVAAHVSFATLSLIFSHKILTILLVAAAGFVYYRCLAPDESKAALAGRAASILVGVLVALRSILEASQDLLQKASASSAGVSKERPPASAVQQRSAKERRSAQMDTAQGWAADAGHAEVNASVRHDLRCKQEPDCLAAGADPLFVPRGPRGVDDAGRHRLS